MTILTVPPRKLALVNAITCGEFEMVHDRDASFMKPSIRLAAKRTKLFAKTVNCKVYEALYLMRPALKVLKATKKMKEALMDASFELHLDRVGSDPPEMSRILSVPVREVVADRNGKLPALQFNYSQSCYFQAKAWDEKTGKPSGDPVGFFLADGTVVEAEIVWKEKPTRGAVEVEAGIVGMYYKAAKM